VALGVPLGRWEVVLDSEVVGAPDALCVCDGLDVPEGDAGWDRLADTLWLGDRVREGVCVADGVDDRLRVADALGVTETLAVAVALAEEACEPLCD